MPTAIPEAERPDELPVKTIPTTINSKITPRVSMNDAPQSAPAGEGQLASAQQFVAGAELCADSIKSDAQIAPTQAGQHDDGYLKVLRWLAASEDPVLFARYDEVDKCAFSKMNAPKGAWEAWPSTDDGAGLLLNAGALRAQAREVLEGQEARQAEAAAAVRPLRLPQPQSLQEPQSQSLAEARARVDAQHAKAKQAQDEYRRLQHDFAQLQEQLQEAVRAQQAAAAAQQEAMQRLQRAQRDRDVMVQGPKCTVVKKPCSKKAEQDHSVFARHSKFGTFEVPKEFLNTSQKAPAAVAPNTTVRQVSKINESRAIEHQKRSTDDETSSRSPGPAGNLLSIDGAEGAAHTVAELATRKVASRPFDKRRRRRAAAKAAKAEEQRRMQVAAEAEAADSADSLQVSAVVEELVGGAMAAADAAAAAAAADLEAARRKQLAERKRQRKRQRDRCSHKKRTNKRKNLRRSAWRKARTQTRAQMAPVLSQLLHLSRSRQASEVVELRSNKQVGGTPRVFSRSEIATVQQSEAAAAVVTEAAAAAEAITAAPAAAAMAAEMAMAMTATEIEPAEAAKVVQVQVELKKRETIMIDASLHLPAAHLRKAFSDRSGVPLDHFELYYCGKRLEAEAALSSYGIRKDATIEVKMRGRGGMEPGGSSGAGGSDVGGGVGGGGGGAGGSEALVANAGMADQMGKKQPLLREQAPSSPSKDHAVKKLQDAQDAGAEDIKASKAVGNGGGGGGDVEGGSAARGVVEAASLSMHQSANEAKVPPSHDVDLSKLLTKLLRHKAVELGVAIDADGWVALSDTIEQINGPRLRAMVGNAQELGSHMYTEADVHEYTEADVRDVVYANDKKRFVLSDDETQIRATQGHDMPGVGEKPGEPLTLETAPEVAVHGSYVTHVQSILQQGLSRMERHHVHLAKGLLGEDGVISGMRSNARVFVWVNVHEAIKDGLTFYESANGVILCSGRDGDGILPRAYFSFVVELHGGFPLETAQVRLLKHAFQGCSRVVVTKLHGGFSGSLVLKTDSYGLDRSRNEPTVTKLDDAESMLEEVAETKQFTKLVGASAARVQRGPYLVNASGQPVEAGASTKEDFGCVVLDMAGACWVMPEFYGKLDAELISTFKQHVVRQFSAQPGPYANIDARAVMQELWGAGGPLRSLALETYKRSESLATQPKRLIDLALQGIIKSLILAFSMPKGGEGKDLLVGYSSPRSLEHCISKVLELKPSWLAEDWYSKIDGLQAKKFRHSLVHDCHAAVWRDEDTCKALVALVDQLVKSLQPRDSNWLADYKPLRMHQHGDLNCGNILVDVRSSLWLIDFAKAGEQALFIDAAKMVSVILFEQFPVPLTLEDLRRGSGSQKLVDALGASVTEAKQLMDLAAACDSKAALVEKVTARDDNYRRLLPSIEDDAVAAQRAKEACNVIDLLFIPGAEGNQLWEIGERQPPAEWPAYAQLALQLCSRVVKLTTELVAECSRREQGNGQAVQADLHPIHFLLPLLKRALSTLCYRDCGSWQKRVAWHAARRLAEALTPLLRQQPQPLPVSTDPVLATTLRLVSGQPVAMLGADGRLDGGLGQRRLFLASAEDDSAQHLLSNEQHSLAFDQVNQTVLPWKVPGPEDVAAQQDLVTIVPALKALRQTIPSLETLANERDQGADGKAVSSLIVRVQQITPKSRALQDRVERQIREVCRDRSTTVAQLKATDARLKAAADAKLRGELEHVFTLGSLEEFMVDQLQHLGGLRVRSYAVGQRLLVHKDGTWLEQAVTHAAPGGAQHELQGTNSQLSIVLHPWNHAPLVLPLASFEALRSRHASTLRSQHASIVDALSGQRLDIFDQCVPIEVVTTTKAKAHLVTEGDDQGERNGLAGLRRSQQRIVGAASIRAAALRLYNQPEPDLARVHEVRGLASWLLAAHAARRNKADAGRTACLLLTAPPAAGKTCLMSQLVMHVVQSKECDMVPILIKVQELQRHLLNEANRPIFEQSWNWVDAFLQCVHGAGSDLYRMLRQALMARRALVLLDGIDEGGKARDAIERHVTEVLAPQGHIMLITSRPAGLNEDRFRQYFWHVKLAPLSEAQQEEVIVKRLGTGEHSGLLEYLRNPDRVPLDHGTKQRVTGNPLMLSMIISIFQSKKGTASSMPATITELYETASRAMLERVDRKERCAAASAASLTSLLEATFFEAHAAEARDFGDAQLNRAALYVFSPDELKKLDSLAETVSRLEAGWESDYIPVRKVQGNSFEVGDIVTYQGKEMVVSKNAKGYGGISVQLKETEQTKRAAKAQYELQLNHACAALPTEAQEALRAVRKRVAQDRLPLLSLLEAEPLLMRSSHLSFQEYFAVRAICTGEQRLPSGSPPWKWGPFWANAVKMGMENRARFGSGLWRAADVKGDELNLSQQLGGDRQTVLAVVCALLGSLRVLDISDNQLGPEGGAALAEGLEGNSTLELLNLAGNQLCGLDWRGRGTYTTEGITKLCEALKGSAVTSLALDHNQLCGLDDKGNGTYTVEGITKLCKGLKGSAVTSLSIGYNRIGAEGASALAAILKETMISNLDLWRNVIGDKGASALAAVLKETQITTFHLGYNEIGAEGASALAAALKETQITTLDLDGNRLCLCGVWTDYKNDIQGTYTTEGITKLCEGLKGSAVTSLRLSGNCIGGCYDDDDEFVANTEGIIALCEGLKGSAVTSLDVGHNIITGDAAENLAAVVLEHAIMTDFCGIPLASLRENSITELDLKDKGVGVPGAIVLSKLLPSAAAVKSLNLEYNQLGPEGGAAIAEGLKGNSTLQSLNLAGIQLCGVNWRGKGTYTVDGITKLCEALKGSAVTSLNLSFNNIGPEGASALAAVLKETQITNLNIWYNSIGAEGASTLAAILKETQITTLNLQYNDLNDQAKQAVKDAAGSGVSITF